MRSDDLAVSLRDVTKSYRLFSHPGDRVRQFLSMGLKQYHRDFTALKGVSLDIRKGETVGLIGRNGAGKSTLLQVICGILKPQTGDVRVDGRVSAMLELGAGFNGEFTGRENVYFQGALLGLSRAQMDARFPDIAAFADIGEFIDQPVRTYSSGMFVRLAFATMVHADADVLIIDEALAVGDGAFQRKCFDKLAEYFEGGSRTLLFVSHNIRQVERICERAVWLEDGAVRQQGPASEVCNAYTRDLNERYVREKGEASDSALQATAVDSGEIEVRHLDLSKVDADAPTDEVQMHAGLRVGVEFRCQVPLIDAQVVLGFHTSDGVFIAAASTVGHAAMGEFAAGDHRIECRFPDVPLLPGLYQVRLGFLDRHHRAMWVGHGLRTFHVSAPAGNSRTQAPLGLVDIPFEWTVTSPKGVR